MKFTIKNLGCIKNVELSLNDLTIIAGENNTGKTYLTYTLYGLLKRWKEFALFNETGNIVHELIEKGNARVSHEEMLRRSPNIVSGITKRYSEKIHEVFSAEKSQFADSEIKAAHEGNSNLPEEKQTYKIGFGKNAVIEGTLENENILFSLTMKNGDDAPPEFILAKGVNLLLADILQKRSFPDPFIFTAERLGISLFYKELDIRRNVLIEKIQKMSQESKKEVFNPFELIEEFSSRFAIPIKDNIYFTRNIDDVQKHQASLKEGKTLADKIKDMMGGYYKHTGVEIRFISKARKEGKFDIPLYLASSSARALCDFYFFLKHEAKPGQLVMIDEPESHLSPANQILLARLLASCVNSGLKVLITTHSDYLIKEFNNLIMLGGEFKGKEDFIKSRKNNYTKDDYLRHDSVSAYICRQGKLSLCSVDHKGMEISSFDNTIDEINRISDELDFLTFDNNKK